WLHGQASPGNRVQAVALWRSGVLRLREDRRGWPSDASARWRSLQEATPQCSTRDLLHSVDGSIMYGQLNKRERPDGRAGDRVAGMGIENAVVAGAMQLAGRLVIEHSAGEMSADIAVGNQPFAWQVDEDPLSVLIGKVKNPPLILGKLTYPSDG